MSLSPFPKVIFLLTICLLLVSCEQSISAVTEQNNHSEPLKNTGTVAASHENNGSTIIGKSSWDKMVITEQAILEPVSTAIIPERAISLIEGQVTAPSSYDFSWTTSSEFILAASLNEQRNGILVEVGDVGPKNVETAVLTVLLNNGQEQLKKEINLQLTDNLASIKATAQIQTEVGENLKQIVDRQITLITDSPFYLNGLIISDKFQAAHYIEIEFVDISQVPIEILDLPEGDWLIGRRLVYGNYVLKDQLGHIWLTKNNSFDGAQQFFLKQQNKIYPSLFLWSNGKTAEFRFAYLHNNTSFVSALLRAFELTSEQKYLELAKSTLDAAVSLAIDDVYARQFLYESETNYSGMDQGILLESVYDYSEYSQDPYYYQKAKDIAAKFKHTTEGTWNHYTNSLIGGLIVDKLNIENPINFNELVDSLSAQLVSEIARLNGFIPYVMNPNHPKYLTLELLTYHTYDMMLIAKQATYIDGRLNSQSIMDVMIERATVNYSVYYANNVEALLYSYMSSGYIHLPFAKQQASMLDIDTSTMQSHISTLRAATAFLYLQELTEYPKLDYNFSQ